MYDPGEKQDEGLLVPELEGVMAREGSSMEIGSAGSELGGLRERRERLERAAKLLSGSGNSKEDGKREVEGEG